MRRRTSWCARSLPHAWGGDLEGLKGLLARDAILWTDGGGRVKAALQPVYGAIRIARFMVGIAGKEPPGVRILPVRVNGDPGLRTDTDSGPRGVVAFELAEGVIVGIRILVNPDKLRHFARMEAHASKPLTTRRSARVD